MAKKRVIDLALLILVAKELQDLCEFDPPIKTKGKSEEDLKKSINEAATQLGPEDELSDDATFVFTELGIEVGAAPAAAAEEEEEEEEAPAPVAKKAAKKAAPAPAEEEEEEEEEAAPAPTKKDTKTAAPAGEAKVKLSSDEKIAFFSPLIESGKYSMKDLLAKSLEKFPGLSESSVRTFLVDSKNAKYNKFPRLVVQSEDGKLTFAAAAAKKKAAAA